jgi:multidrug resistance efflux pump
VTEELEKLRIDREGNGSRSARPGGQPHYLAIALLLILVVAGGVWLYARHSAPAEAKSTGRQAAPAPPAPDPNLVLSATGYIVAAHKIELATKVVGKVAWIGVDKSDRVHEGQELVRLEDDEYRAQVQQARGQVASLRARLAELENGSRPEEVAKAKADLDQARSDLENARVTLTRTRGLVEEGVAARQTLDDAQARYDGAVARAASLDRAFELVRIGPRREEIDSMRAQVEQAQGALDLAQTQLANTVIRAPISGTVLERNVEVGEFVTTGFVGDRGAKGYVVSLANLNDLEVELDISQNDFARLDRHQPGIVTVDAYPDRPYRGEITEISPEANRQKATVQVKVRILSPDAFLRPEMNATVRFTRKN